MLTRVFTSDLQPGSQFLYVEKMMKNLRLLTAGASPLLTGGVALAQTGTMMGGGNSGFGWMGGYGGVWMPVLLIVVIVALVVLVIQRKDK
jgi:uncharacterized membrane protein